MSVSRIMVLSAAAYYCAAGAVWAQAETPADAAPSRPVIMPMTPGSELRQQKPAGREQAKPQKPRIIPVTPAAAPGSAIAGTPASRGVKESPNDYLFCNQTSYVLSIAVGIKNGPLLATRGWWIVPAGECKVVIKGPLTQTTYFTFARSSFAHTGPIRNWGGTNSLCTGKGNFQAAGDGSSQCGPGYDSQGFSRIDTEGKPGWKTTLTEGAAVFKSMDQARIAGFQRLLSDISLFDGQVDGVGGPKFNEALGQARTTLRLSSSDPATLYSALLAEATRIQSNSGLTFCNRTPNIIWTAYGREVQGKLQSRGWYKLQPEQCEKVIKERLSEPAVYAFASVDKSEGVAETWSGSKQFCTKESSFEFDDSINCAGKGFASSGFFEIDSRDKPYIAFEFSPRKILPDE